jgi:hypothetical protein
VADVIYPFVFAYRWGAKVNAGGNAHEPRLEQTLAAMQERLAGLKVARVERTKHVIASSLSSRVFSMAMTAWEANVLSISRCLSDSGPGVRRTTLKAPIDTPVRISGMIVTARYPLARKFRAPAARSSPPRMRSAYARPA